MLTNRTRAALAGVLIAAILTPLAAAQHRCSQDHPGKAHRLAQSIKDGDVAVCKGIAGHTVRHALERFEIADLMTAEDMTRAANQMYDFLKWRLGSPTLVTAQYLTQGYEHFDRGYSDEAAAMLLRVFEFKAQQPELTVPVWMQSWIEQQVGKAGDAIATLLASQGVPPAIAGPLAEKIAQALQNLAERNSVGMFVPKSFDVENRLVEAAITARRAVAEGGVPTGTSLPDRKTASKFGSRGNPSPPSEPTTNEPAGDRIAALEQRITALEAAVMRIVAALDDLGEPGAADMAPAAAGYASLQMYGRTGGRGRLHVEVNGVQIAIFDNDKQLDLTPFLVAGRRNTLSFRFEPTANANLGDLTVSLTGTLAGLEEPIEFLKFGCSKDRLADSVEVPVAPKS